MKLGLKTEVTPEALLEAAQSLHDAADPAEEHVSRAGALLHQLNTFAGQGIQLGSSPVMTFKSMLMTSAWDCSPEVLLRQGSFLS